MKLALLAECSPRIGSGHVVETAHLARQLNGSPWRAFVSRATPPALRRRFGRKPTLMRDFSPRSLAALGSALRRGGFGAAVLNFQRIDPAQVAALRRHGLKVGCLWTAGRAPACELAVHVDSDPGYLCMAPEFARLGRKAREHRGPLKNILLLMGGTDNSGSTLVLIEALRGAIPRVRKHIVAGPNFFHKARLRSLARSLGPSFIFHWNPSRLPALMRRCDAAFTLGGNTCLELACVGTPTILLEEAPHERRQALLLARKGCGFFLGSERDVARGNVLRLLARLQDPALRSRMARAGQRLVDGRGSQRLAARIKGLLK